MGKGSLEKCGMTATEKLTEPTTQMWVRQEQPQWNTKKATCWKGGAGGNERINAAQTQALERVNTAPN